MGFTLIVAPTAIHPAVFFQMMYQAEWSAESGWSAGSLMPYGPISLMPSAQVLNYGQSIFEGMKAYRGVDGQLRLFRPEENATRFSEGAARMCMAAVPIDMFLRAVELVVQANASEASQLLLCMVSGGSKSDLCAGPRDREGFPVLEAPPPGVWTHPGLGPIPQLQLSDLRFPCLLPRPGLYCSVAEVVCGEVAVKCTAQRWQHCVCTAAVPHHIVLHPYTVPVLSL
jgi:hypothetical protein